MWQSPCDVTAYHTYNGSEIAPLKMQNIASCITGCLCPRKKYKNIYRFHTIQTFIFTKKTKMILPRKPPFKHGITEGSCNECSISLKHTIHAILQLLVTLPLNYCNLVLFLLLLTGDTSAKIAWMVTLVWFHFRHITVV